MQVFKHVLAATDFSEASTAAVELAVTIARECGARLTLINVCEVPVFVEVGAQADLITPIAEMAWAKLGDLQATLLPRVPGVARIQKVGAPWEQVLAAAAECGVDLLVVGTHGRRGVSHVILGSVAERLVRQSRIPVLTVRGMAG
jgi:nucleotide-binding universal stress UspA family protein